MQKVFKKVTAALVAATMALTLITVSAYQETEGDFAATRQVGIATANELMEALSIAGMTVAVVDIDSGWTWLQGFGYADVANQVSVNEHTLFNIGSTAKVFTSIAILQLVEEGVLDLDEPIVTYLPEFSVLPNPVFGGDYRNITTRMLITHTSGVHEWGGDGFATPYGHDRDLMNRLLPTLANLHMQNEEMNRMTYNNTGYALLGILVARLTGGTNYFDGFIRYTQDNIFTPADMVSSSFEINQHNRPNVATPYDNAETPSEWILYVGPTSAGGMVSNALDMAQFMRVMLDGGGNLLTPESVRAMTEVQDLGIVYPTAMPGNMQMGLGLMRLPRPGGFVTTGHAGGLQHVTEMFLDFDNGIGVFVSSNTMTAAAAVTHLALAILNTAVYEKTGASPVQTVDLDARNRFNPQNLQDVVGWYTLIGDLELLDDGLLHFTQFPGLPMPLTLMPIGGGRFATEIGAEFHFEEVGGIVFAFLDGEMLGERIEVSAATADFERWVGAYYVLDENDTPLITPLTPTTIFGINENGFAFMSQDGIMHLMNRVDDYTFHFPGRSRMFGSIGEFSMDGDVAMFRYSGWTFVRREPTPIELRLEVGNVEYLLNGNVYEMENAPFVDYAYFRTMVPLRLIAEVFGAEVDWNNENRVVTIAFGDVSLELPADEPLPEGMGVPHNIEGRIFVPIRYVAYALGVNVDWDDDNQAVYVFE